MLEEILGGIWKDVGHAALTAVLSPHRVRLRRLVVGRL